MNNKIFLLYTCDENKGIQSDSLILVTTSLEKVVEVIIGRIKLGLMSYYHEEMTKEDQISWLIDDWEDDNIDIIDSRLIYGYCHDVYDGVTIN